MFSCIRASKLMTTMMIDDDDDHDDVRTVEADLTKNNLYRSVRIVF